MDCPDGMVLRFPNSVLELPGEVSVEKIVQRLR